jgi:hypothetical protein
MPEEPSSTADQNHCQPASAISEPANNHTRPRILTFAKWLRRFGYVIIILAVAWTIFYHYRTLNYMCAGNYFEYKKVELYLYDGTRNAFYLWQIAFFVISISLGIRYIVRKESTKLLSNEQLNGLSFSSKYFFILILLWLPIYVGCTFLSLNFLGYNAYEKPLHLYGWPIAHSGCQLNDPDWEGGSMFKDLFKFFSLYWTIVDFILAVLIVFCNILAIRYVMRRLSNKRQYFLKEILIIITATAIFLSLRTIEQYSYSRDKYVADYIAEDWYTYQPLHALPLYMQIPTLIGITCVVMVLGTALFELFGLGMAKMFRTDAEED